MNWIDAERVEFSRFRSRSIVTAAQWCCAFQIRLGEKITSASTPPATSHRPASSRQRPDSTTPTPSPNRRNATLYLFISPTPATPPIASHSRWSSVRSSRTNSVQMAAQKKRSNVAVDRR